MKQMSHRESKRDALPSIKVKTKLIIHLTTSSNNS
uniref:Uncharacterized protein n=1 Tax=Rhizophora mucronata TaxID=61149 RepID=A0A2P2KHW0_RHIMU